MSMIQKKLKKNEYANVTEMSTDLYLMIDNAKKANLPSSKIFKDAVKMQKILNQKLVDDGLDDDDTEDTEDSSQHNSVQGSENKKKKVWNEQFLIIFSRFFFRKPQTCTFMLKKKAVNIHEFITSSFFLPLDRLLNHAH